MVNLGRVAAIALRPQLLQPVPDEAGLHIFRQVLAPIRRLVPLEIPAA